MNMPISYPENYRAALYIRLSKEDEGGGQSQSVTNQKSLLDEFVKDHSISVYDTYIDDGFSGTNFERPAFKRMIGDIEAQRVNMVITKDLSRLGRDYIMTGHYMERYFPEHRVRYISLLDGIDTGVESGANDITPFRAIMNDMYAKDISRKIKSVKHDKQRKGQFIGGKPVYGYRMHPEEKNKIIVDEPAAANVRRIFAMALDGMSCRRIASQLNEENIATPASYCGWNMGRKGAYAGLWSGERISEMLRNETYIGNMVQGRSVKLSYKSKKSLRQRPEDWIVVENTHEPLVDRETFHKVAMMLQSRRHTQSRKYDFLLKGLVFCHECGYPLAVINRPDAAGKDRLYFMCRTYQRFTTAGICSCHSVSESKVTKAVLEKVREICLTRVAPERLLAIADNYFQREKERCNTKAETESLKKRIELLTESLDKMYLDKLSGLLSEADFGRIYHKLKADLDALEKRVKELEELEYRFPEPKYMAEAWVQRFLDEAYMWRDVLVSLIERIEINEERDVLIKFRFKEP